MRAHPSFGMTTTEDIRDPFAWRSPAKKMASVWRQTVATETHNIQHMATWKNIAWEKGSKILSVLGF